MTDAARAALGPEGAALLSEASGVCPCCGVGGPIHASAVCIANLRQRVERLERLEGLLSAAGAVFSAVRLIPRPGQRREGGGG